MTPPTSRTCNPAQRPPSFLSNIEVLRALCIAIAVAAGGCRSEPEVAETRPSAPAVEPSDAPVDEPPDRRAYMGRQKAQTMSHLGADWLLRPEREAEEKVSEMIDALQLRPGDTACDIGAGVGVHSLMMAAKVAPSGRVLAVDIQPEMLEGLEARAAEAGIDNVGTILGTQTDPKLPAAACDVILLVDVYHELADPEAMLAGMRDALSDRGRIALVEFRAEDPLVPIKPLHKMSKEQILKEFPPNGFKLVETYDELPWQHLMFFARTP